MTMHPAAKFAYLVFGAYAVLSILIGGLFAAMTVWLATGRMRWLPDWLPGNLTAAEANAQDLLEEVSPRALAVATTLFWPWIFLHRPKDPV